MSMIDTTGGGRRRTGGRGGRRTITGPSIDDLRPDIERPGIDRPGEVIVVAKPSPPPLLLLPLRLEYRVVDRLVPVVDRPSFPGAGRVLDELLGPARTRSRRLITAADRPDLLSRLRRSGLARETGRRPAELIDSLLVTRRELWFRWYPDDAFVEKGIAPPTDDELAALADTSDLLDGRSWTDEDDPEVASAFASLASRVGPARAVHLLRTGADGGDPDWGSRAGKLVTPPRQVTLFALHGETLTRLASGARMPADLAYDGDLFDTGHWMYDFDQVVERGLGIRVTDVDAVEAALRADWVVAVGVHGGDASGAVERFVADAVANGEFSVLPNGRPTNSAVGAPVTELDPLADLVAFRREASEDERGLHRADTPGAADLLAEALGVDPAIVRQAVRSSDLGFEDAKAMIRVIGPALTEELANLAVPLALVDNDDLVDFCATWMAARGQLPMLRVGSNPYGLLPITELSKYQAPVGATDEEAGVQEFVRDYGGWVRHWLSQTAAAAIEPIEPGDLDAGRKLEDALKLSAVSRRVDVGDAGATDTRPVGCPYVDHRDHHPADYLHSLLSEPLDRLPDPSDADVAWPLLYRLARQAATLRVLHFQGVVASQLSDSGKTSMLQAADRLGGVDVIGQLTVDGPIIFGRGRGTIGRDVPTRPFDLPGPGQPRRRFVTTEGPVDGQSAAEPGDGPGSPAVGPRRRVADTIVTNEVRAVRSATALASASIVGIATTDGLAGIDRAVAERFRVFTRGFGDALAHLESIARRPDGASQLATLLAETIDLFQHRVDAWATGLAYHRLATRRRAGLTGLRAGYYGLLGRLRPESVTGRTDGYLQAPSPDQAISTAVMRAAHLRYVDGGPFDLDLSSRRVRRALDLLDLVSKGLSIDEILGLVGERWLHDRHHDQLISMLRGRFPFRHPTEGTVVEIRLFDGDAFLRSSLGFGLSGQDRAILRELQTVLGDDLDALSDLVMAEAVHQRVIGNVTASYAWQQVLAGEPAPSEPTYIRTRRLGHGSSHRVMLVLDPVGAVSSAGPRAQAEPTLHDLAARAMPTFEKAKVVVRLDGSGERPPEAMELRLAEDLGVTPFDLVVGGVGELTVRSRAEFLHRWQTDPSLTARLGPAPVDLDGLGAAGGVTVDLEAGVVKPSRLLSVAGSIRRPLARARTLDPGDLQAAAPATEPLPEAVAIKRWIDAADELRERAAGLRDRLATTLAGLGVAADQVVVRARNRQTLQMSGATATQLASATGSLQQAERRLDQALAEAASFAEPAALALRATAVVAVDIEVFAEHVVALQARLRDRLETLDSATRSVPTVESLAEARGDVNRRIEAIRTALDGRALVILPRFDQSDGTTMALEPATAPGARLGEWADVRPAVADALDLARSTGWRASSVAEAATDDETGDDTADRRPETEAPRSRFFGTVLSPVDAPSALPRVCGLVLDEWSESRPSRSQMTGVAVNYDSPQSQAPNCVLLCEPPTDGAAPWGAAGAARMVAEMIEWMTVRSLPTDLAAPFGPWLAGNNRVRRKTVDGESQRRVPKQRLSAKLFPHDFRDGAFNVVAEVTHRVQINEIGQEGGG